MNFFSSLFSKPQVEIVLKDPGRRCVYLRDDDDKRIKLPNFFDKENVEGEVVINLTSRSFDHKGIKIVLLGIVEDKINNKVISQFITLSKDLSPPGTLNEQVSTFKFCFNNVEKLYESYRGNNYNVRYLLRVFIKCTLRELQFEREFGVSRPSKKDVLSVGNEGIKLNVGIEDKLHLTFELDRSKYTTKDTVTGKIEFKLANYRLKNMLLQIIKRESVIGGETDNSTICRFEIMDGSPIKDETIPIRFFLCPYELTPTYENVDNKFSVSYILNLVLYDENDKRFYKQSEIKLFRVYREEVEEEPKKEEK